jgi:hypothetical protein
MTHEQALNSVSREVSRKTEREAAGVLSQENGRMRFLPWHRPWVHRLLRASVTRLWGLAQKEGSTPHHGRRGREQGRRTDQNRWVQWGREAERGWRETRKAEELAEASRGPPIDIGPDKSLLQCFKKERRGVVFQKKSGAHRAFLIKAGEGKCTRTLPARKISHEAMRVTYKHPMQMAYGRATSSSRVTRLHNKALSHMHQRRAA